jgi:ubiquinone/menaquinone biosynthesis C-methylase UbiE
MNEMNQAVIKREVRDYWDAQPCGTQFSENVKYSQQYFDDIENFRYNIEPEIFSFAQFTRFHAKKVLEVGVGAGTDFLQWVRAGAQAYGVDATSEGIKHVLRRLDTYNLTASEVRIADCEALPYEDNTFDLVYSWGVIHHTPNTMAAMHELIRVCKPGGICKVMIYHRHSLLAYFFWMKYALLRGKPWKSLKWCLYNHMESLGTKAYTTREVYEMLADQPVDSVDIRPKLTYYDQLVRFNPILRTIAKICSWALGGNRVGWFLTIQLIKRG